MANAEIILRRFLEKIADEHDFNKNKITITPITSEGSNYTSVLFVVKVNIGNEDVELFAKVACIGNKLQEDIHADRLFRLEAFFYKKLSKFYTELEQKHNVCDEDRFIYPKFYGCDTTQCQESILLENMVANGYQGHNRLVSVDWEQAAASIEALAKFHALSFAYNKNPPEEFVEDAKDLVFVPVKVDQMKVLLNSVENAVTMVKDEYKPRLSRHLEKYGVRGFKEFTMPLNVKVIVHGDYRPCNLLYKRQDNKVQAVILDYQTIHFGSPASDLLYFELCGTDRNFRAEHHDRLIDHYYNELNAALQRLGVDAAEVYPRELWDSEVKELMPYTVILAAFLLPVVLVTADEAPKTDENKGLGSFIVANNQLFLRRFTEIVEDCIIQGIL